MYRQQRLLNFPELRLTEAQLENHTLYKIEKILENNNRSLKDFPPLLLPNRDSIHDDNNRLLREELSHDIQRLIMEHKEMHSGLNVQHMHVYNIIVQSAIEKKDGLYFVYGAGGTGKTYLYKTTLSRLRSEGKICLDFASSGIASLLLPGGRTAHSRFSIPIDLNDQSICNIHQGTHLAKLMKKKPV
ncbi:hypothetical protein Dsin_001011 [Dipteronia sinensis]|uniref:ATP-dependent DNA helicase n=1 Tax=Dipteronia sinensis TaxID=43782 RepID=A0AAE0B4H8_9ROSI|nr:hypothetical protein Dsin_001011 [Dipteronia sinensis]